MVVVLYRNVSKNSIVHQEKRNIHLHQNLWLEIHELPDTGTPPRRYNTAVKLRW